MKQIFIDKFTIPRIVIKEFMPRMNYNIKFIKTLPGFENGSVYRRIDENGNIIVITVAVWRDEDSLNNAKEKVQAEYQRIQFNPAELLPRLNITVERGIYEEVQD
jgi:hypothetical protein